MISLIQRVTKGSVSIQDKEISLIRHGYVVVVGIFKDDTDSDVTQSVEKITNMRIMADKNDKMNKSILETGGEVLLVSQFTLCADHTYGRRPSFITAMEPDEAKRLFDLYAEKLRETGISVQTGSFGEYMHVEICNDGPVTIIFDTKKS